MTPRSCDPSPKATNVWSAIPHLGKDHAQPAVICMCTCPRLCLVSGPLPHIGRSILQTCRREKRRVQPKGEFVTPPARVLVDVPAQRSQLTEPPPAHATPPPLQTIQRFAAVIMRVRQPKTTALIFASGKMVVTGAKSEDDARLAARKYARIIQKLGFEAQFTEFKIQNMVGSCDVKFPIRLEGLAFSHGHFSSYEPEVSVFVCGGGG